MEWNFLFKRDYWRRRPPINQVQTFEDLASTEPLTTNAVSRRDSGSAAVVHVDHLVKKFGPDKVAVNDVSFDLYANQITSLLGPNGSGKTAIFNCLIGIYQQTSGTITMATEDGLDHDTRDQIETLRKSIGYCPQHDILFDLLTIEEQLQFYATARGFGKYKQEIAADMLERVNLQTSKDTYCQSLSGGMKRRLSLACAFVGDTKIILLDEVSRIHYSFH
jgi:ABC-type multidrug transport system ATPase subunit